MVEAIFSPGRSLSQRHARELDYLRAVKAMLLNDEANSDLDWSRYGLTWSRANTALLEHEELAAAMTSLTAPVRTRATIDFNVERLGDFPSGTLKRWVAHHDTLTRPAHLALDGTTIPIDASFMSEGRALMYPGDPAAPPALTYNCRCILVAVRRDR